MLEELKKIKKIDYIIIIGVGIVILFSFYLSLKGNKIQNKYASNNSGNTDVIYKLPKDEFSIKVTKTINEDKKELLISCIKNICTYDIEEINQHLVLYKDKYYELVSSSTDKKEYIESTLENINNEFNERYYNMSFFEYLILNIEWERENDTNYYSSNFTLENYLKEYNYYFNEVNKTDKEVEIPIVLTFMYNEIIKIKFDYKEIDNYFNETQHENFIYEIEILDFEKEKFKIIEEYFEEFVVNK